MFFKKIPGLVHFCPHRGCQDATMCALRNNANECCIVCSFIACWMYRFDWCGLFRIVACQSRKVVLECREVTELGLEIHFRLKVRFEGEISSPNYDLCGLGKRSGWHKEEKVAQHVAFSCPRACCPFWNIRGQNELVGGWRPTQSQWHGGVDHGDVRLLLPRLPPHCYCIGQDLFSLLKVNISHFWLSSKIWQEL